MQVENEPDAAVIPAPEDPIEPEEEPSIPLADTEISNEVIELINLVGTQFIF